MRKIFSSKLLLVFSTIGLLIYSVIYACSDNGSWSWIFDSNFTPETFVDKSYSPLFLSPDVFYGISFDQQHSKRFNDEMIDDWTTYLAGSMSQEEVNFFLVDSSATDVITIHTFLENRKSNRSINKWSKIINFKDKKVCNFMTFLYHAQALEAVSVSADQWSYEPVKKVLFNDAMRLKNIESRYTATIDEFLKNRYWFLTIKAYFYSGEKQKADSFFQETEKLMPKNTLYYRAISYLAGLEYQNKNYATSNYMYAQVFDKCPKLRVVAAYCFHPQEQLDWNQSLAMAKNKDEKAALWAIQGYYGNEEQAIQKIFLLNPKSEHLDYLLTRLINQQENKIDKSFKDRTVLQNKQIVKDSINKNTIELVANIAKSNTTAKPYLWNIAAGYLEVLNGNFIQADKNFDEAEAIIPKTLLAVNQLRLLRFVNNLSKINSITISTEKSIISDLNWLYFELPKENLPNFRYENATSWSRNYLSSLYRAQENSVMAELFSKENDFYDSKTKLEAMKVFLSKENKTAIETTATKLYDIGLFDINEFQAIEATYENKISKAINFMKQTDSLQYRRLLANPFNGSIKDCHDCEHAIYQKKKYNRVDFLTTIKVMQDKLEKQEDVYSNSLLLGNAFYNLTFFGNARLFYGGRINGYGSTVYDFRESTKNRITNCSLAATYYQKAFEAAQNEEQKAKCQYLLAKCQRNEFYNKKYQTVTKWWQIEAENINFLAWNGFKNLKNNYSKTKYYQDVIAECGYFDTYINQ